MIPSPTIDFDVVEARQNGQSAVVGRKSFVLIHLSRQIELDEPASGGGGGAGGQATTIKMGGRASLLGSRRFLQDQNPFSLHTDITYLCTYGLAFLARPGLREETQVSREKSRTSLARSRSETKLPAR